MTTNNIKTNRERFLEKIDDETIITYIQDFIANKSCLNCPAFDYCNGSGVWSEFMDTGECDETLKKWLNLPADRNWRQA